jgi:hypothetical protein
MIKEAIREKTTNLPMGGNHKNQQKGNHLYVKVLRQASGRCHPGYRRNHQYDRGK